MALITYLMVFLFGIGLGGMYFGGLWWTVTAVTDKRYSMWWLAISFLVRMTLLACGLYFVLLVSVWHLMLCLAGVFTARVILVRRMAKVGCAKMASSD
jgi:F1F0 ATPase subunit 2